MYRVVLYPHLKKMFFWSGICFIVFTSVIQGIVLILPYQWPFIIPILFGITLIIIGAAMTWRYYLLIIYFAPVSMRPLQEKIEKKQPDRFLKIRRTLYVGTILATGGAAVLGSLCYGYLKYPFQKYDDPDLNIQAISMMMSSGCTLLVLYLGGVPSDPAENSGGSMDGSDKMSATEKSRSRTRTIDESHSTSIAPVSLLLIQKSNSDPTLSSHLTQWALISGTISGTSTSVSTTTSEHSTETSAEPSPSSKLNSSPSSSPKPMESPSLHGQAFPFVPTLVLDGSGTFVEKVGVGFAPSLATAFEVEEKDTYVV